MKAIAIWFLSASCLALSGCFGTIGTRCQKPASFAGRYPYSGVAMDVVVVATMPVTDGGPLAPFALISVPFDLIADSVLLLPDLICWPFGHKKNWP